MFVCVCKCVWVCVRVCVCVCVCVFCLKQTLFRATFHVLMLGINSVFGRRKGEDLSALLSEGLTVSKKKK